MKDSLCVREIFVEAIYDEIEFIVNILLRRSLDRSHPLSCLSSLFDPIIYLPLAIFFCLFLCLKLHVKRFASNVHITGMSIGSHTTKVRINLLHFQGIAQFNVNLGAI